MVNLIISTLGVFEVKPDGSGLVLIELAPGVTLDEIAAKTQAKYEVALKG